MIKTLKSKTVFFQVSSAFYSSIPSAKTQSEIFDTILFSTITTGSLEVSKTTRQKLVEVCRGILSPSYNLIQKLLRRSLTFLTIKFSQSFPVGYITSL